MGYGGSRSGKLTDDQVRSICELIVKGLNNVEIAKELNDKNITDRIVANIRRGTTYRGVSSEYKFKYVKHSMTDEDTVRSICKDLEKSKMTLTEIADKNNVRLDVVRKIKNRETFINISADYNIDYNIGSKDRLDENTVHRICRYLECYTGCTSSYIAQRFGVKVETVRRIRRGESFTEISSRYNIKPEKNASISINR